MANDFRALIATVIGCSIEEVHDDSDFFGLGGDSVGAMRLSNEAQKAGLRTVTIPFVYEHSRVGEMLAACSASADGEEEKADEGVAALKSRFASGATIVQHWELVNDCIRQTGLSPGEVEEMYPCMITQQRTRPIMFPTLLTVPATMESHLVAALEKVHQSNPMMRTRFFMHGDVAYQVVVKEKLPLREDPGPVKDYLAHNRRCPMDIGQPLSRYAIVRSADRVHVIWTLSHGISDRFSRKLVVDQLKQCLQHPDVSVKSIPPFKSLVEWYCDPVNRDAGLAFWKDYLQDPGKFAVFHDPSISARRDRMKVLKKPGLAPASSLPGITPATLAHVAWALCLARYSGFDEVKFLSIRSGRQIPGQPHLSEMAAPLAQNVPFQLLFDNAPLPMKDLLRQTQASIVRTFSEELFAGLAIAKYVPPSTHFMQSRFAYNMEPLDVSETVTLHGFGSDEEEAKLELSGQGYEGYFHEPSTSYVSVTPDCITVIHDQELVPPEKISALLDDFIATMDHLQTSAPWEGMTVADLLPRLGCSNTETPKSPTESPPEGPTTLANLLPSDTNSLSVIIPQEDHATSLSQAQLRKCVESVQSQIAPLNLPVTSAVVLALPNSLEFMVAFLALASMRYIVAPVNPALKKQEVDFYLEDIDAKLVVVPKGEVEAESAATRSAKERGVVVVEIYRKDGEVLVDVKGGIERDGVTNGLRAAEPQENDVALILHTSGTTGRPKAVPLTHKNLVTSADNLRRTYDLNSKDRTMLIMPLYHIHGIVASFLATLRAGGTVIVPNKLHPSFWRDFQKHGATWYTATPTMHSVILQFDTGDWSQHRSPRFIRSCSSALSPALFHRLEEKFQCPIVESYAMTEASHLMTSNPLPPGARKPGSVGLPQGVELELRNDRGEAVARDAEGEVCIRGENVTHGYLDNPEANESAFWSDGFFRTGDQGRLDEDGYLTLTGRLKEFINKGGEKISPVEIDNVLARHEDVDEVVCFAVNDDVYGQDVGAAVRGKDGRDVDVVALRRWLGERVAAHKLPRKIWVLDEIPKTSTGKVQRRLVAERVAML